MVRLNGQHVWPKRYEVTLFPHVLNTNSNNNSNTTSSSINSNSTTPRFSGRVEIDLVVEKDIPAFLLHCQDLHVASGSLQMESDTFPLVIETRDTTQGTVEVSLGNKLQEAEHKKTMIRKTQDERSHKLVIVFQGLLSGE